MIVQLGECLAGHPRSAVGRPSPIDRVQSCDHCFGVGPSQSQHLGGEPFPMPSQGRLGWLDQQLALVAADVEPQEVETLVEVDDLRLLLVEDLP